VAADLDGPVAGFAGLGAIQESDKGWLSALKAAAEGGLTGAALQVMGPASRPVRLTGASAMTYAQARLNGADNNTALANATTMGLVAGAAPGGKSVKQAVGDAVDTYTGGTGPMPRALDPTKAAAVDFLREQNVPLKAGTITGNRFLQSAEAVTANSLLGAPAAADLLQATNEGLARVSGQLADQVSPEPATPETAGRAAARGLDQNIASLNAQENDAYARAWQDAGNPAYTKRVQVGTTQKPITDNVGRPTGQTEAVPVMGDVNMPVDVRWMKDIAGPALEKMQYMPAAEQAQSAAYAVYKRIMAGPGYISAEQAEEALKGLKGEARGADNPNLRNASQGAAANLIGRLQDGIDAAVGETGPEAADALNRGRNLHFQKMQIADVADKLRAEPVQAFNELIFQKDKGIDYLRQVGQQAPDVLPQLGRANLDDLFDQATAFNGPRASCGSGRT
jgi:hypothetical protein